MRVLFFIDSLRAGGKERRLVELLKWLKSNSKLDFELIVMSYNIHYQEIMEFGVCIHYVIRKTKKDILLFKRLFDICKAYKPDLIHCWDSMTAIYSVPVCRLLKIPLINGMVIDSPVKRNIFNKYWLRAKITFPFSKVIVGNSNSGLVAYKAPARKSQVIHNGFNFRRIENINSSDEIRKQLNIQSGFVIGMVASFSGYKDYKTYYEGAKLVLSKRSDLTFLAIGSHTDSDESINLVEKKYHNSFRFLGKKQEVESYINAMDICVLVTFTEGISNAILEYMALSKPVVATEGGGTSELVSDGQTGFLIKRSDSGDFAEKLEHLLNDPVLRKKMGVAGKKRIEEYFSIDKMSSKYIDLYNSVYNK
jgi:glycosyltransferase involved in cell wall biosynthesis